MASRGTASSAEKDDCAGMELMFVLLFFSLFLSLSSFSWASKLSQRWCCAAPILT